MCNHVAMPNIDEGASEWQSELSRRFGQAVAAYRKQQGLTAAELAERTRNLGYPIHRVAITKIETNSRGGKLNLSEVVILALALGIPPVQLIYPDLPDGTTEVWPGAEVTSLAAVRWFSGQATAQDTHLPAPISDNERIRLATEYSNAESAMRVASAELDRTIQAGAELSEDEQAAHAPLAAAVKLRRDDATKRFFRIKELITARGWPVNDGTPPVGEQIARDLRQRKEEPDA